MANLILATALSLPTAGEISASHAVRAARVYANDMRAEVEGLRTYRIHNGFKHSFRLVSEFGEEPFQVQTRERESGRIEIILLNEGDEYYW